MSAFTYTKLEPGEVMVIRPVTFSSARPFSFSAGGGQGAQVRWTNERKIGITNRRVIVEQGNQPHVPFHPLGRAQSAKSKSGASGG